MGVRRVTTLITVKRWKEGSSEIGWEVLTSMWSDVAITHAVR